MFRDSPFRARNRLSHLGLVGTDPFGNPATRRRRPSVRRPRGRRHHPPGEQIMLVAPGRVDRGGQDRPAGHRLGPHELSGRAEVANRRIRAARYVVAGASV